MQWPLLNTAHKYVDQLITNQHYQQKLYKEEAPGVCNVHAAQPASIGLEQSCGAALGPVGLAMLTKNTKGVCHIISRVTDSRQSRFAVSTPRSATGYAHPTAVVVGQIAAIHKPSVRPSKQHVPFLRRRRGRPRRAILHGSNTATHNCRSANTAMALHGCVWACGTATQPTLPYPLATPDPHQRDTKTRSAPVGPLWVGLGPPGCLAPILRNCTTAHAHAACGTALWR